MVCFSVLIDEAMIMRIKFDNQPSWSRARDARINRAIAILDRIPRPQK
jgi:hypothetical protein